MHAVKDVAHVWLTPFMLAVSIGALALAARIGRRRRTAVGLAMLAVAIAYLGSTSLVGDLLCGPLERRFAAFAGAADATHVVVLGSGYAPVRGVPVTAALDEDGLVRLVEGVRIYRLLGHARLVVSGGAPAGETPSALGYAQLAKGLGVDPGTIDVLDKPLDTREEAQEVRALVGRSPFVLVTTAVHMPRAMALMQRAGLHPIAAPTGQTVGVPPILGWRALLPTSFGLRKTERALHEYAGLIAMQAGSP